MNAPAHAMHRRHSWSWRFGSMFGIDLRVHATFVVLLIWIAASHLLEGHGIEAAAFAVLALGLVFGSVVLHELGHALVARRYGICTRDITLWPIGGIASLERLPDDPRQELAIAVAGPAVNFVIAAASALIIALFGMPWSPAMLTMGAPLFADLLWMNVGLGVFNLLPAFPMDGGRVLRALLATHMSRVRATDIAARVGQAMALFLGLAGLFGNSMLLFIALFVWIAGHEEAAAMRLTAALAPLHVGDAMLTTFETLPAGAPVAEGAARAVRTLQREFPVVDGGRLVGVVSTNELIAANDAGRSMMPIGGAASPIEGTVSPSDRVTSALERFATLDRGALPVLEGNAIVGLFVPERIFELAAGGLHVAA